MSKLYIVATPIGNLEDITLRAIRILKEADFVLCEDTRVTQKLLQKYDIKTKTVSYHQHSSDSKESEIVRLLQEGKTFALVSDAGTPNVSDPGGKLVQSVLQKTDGSIEIESVPGPSALSAAISVAGISLDKFTFLGFLPHKKGRQTILRKISESEFPVILYESKHRIIKLLEELIELKKINPKRDKHVISLDNIIVCRELTKMHETVYRGEIKDIKSKLKENSDNLKGEFVIIIY